MVAHRLSLSLTCLTNPQSTLSQNPGPKYSPLPIYNHCIGAPIVLVAWLKYATKKCRYIFFFFITFLFPKYYVSSNLSFVCSSHRHVFQKICHAVCSPFCVFYSFDIVCFILCLCVSLVSCKHCTHCTQYTLMLVQIYFISCIFMFLCVSTLPAVFLCFL